MAQGYDCVFGTRFGAGGSIEAPLVRRTVSRGGTWLTNLLLGTRLTDMTSGYQVYRRQVLEEILAKGIEPSTHFFQTEMKAYARKYRVTEVPIRYSVPSDSVKGATILDSLRLLGRLFLKRLRGRL
jgi:dolichol-phosphate mannosyltransferase